jgi:hypothetical protein
MAGKFISLLLIILLNFSATGLSGQVTDTTSFTLIPRLSFYSNEINAELLLHVPGSVMNNVLNIRIILAERNISEWTGRANRTIIRIPLDLNQVTISGKIKAEIIVNKWNSPEGGIRYISKCDLVILPYKSNEVKTDRLTGGLIVNRRQFFPFGFYCYSPVYPTLPEEEVVKGFNMISPYQKILKETLQERKAYMDRCAQLGMKVHYNLLSVSGGGGVGSEMKGYTDAQKRDLLINEIKTFRDHPALLAWYISDEPTGNNISPETLEEIYNVVKENDPWHPVSIVFMAPFLSSRRFENAVDIVMADPYPIPDMPASMVGEVADKLKKEFHGEKPVWIVPQAFGGGEWWGREPSIQEIRSMTYQSVISGATGIQYFIRQGLNSFPKSVSTWNECGRMAVEIAELTPWLLSDETANYTESYTKNVAVTSKLHNGQLLILAVNKINEPQRADIGITGIGNARAKVIFENRTITVSEGIISELLPAFGSQAYIIKLFNIKDEYLPWQKNLIKDPGFEDVTSTGIPAACYARPGEDRGATYFLDSREHFEGNHSLRIVTPKDSNSVTIRFFPVKVNTGGSYMISVWAKRDPDQRLPRPFSPAEPSYGAYNKEPQFVEISLGEYGKARFTPQSEWKQFVTFVTIPPDSVPTTKTNVILKMPGQGVAWFDLLQVIEDPMKNEVKNLQQR